MPISRVLCGFSCALSLVLACTEKDEGSTDGPEDETTGTATTEPQSTAGDSTTAAPSESCECSEGDPCAVALCETVAWTGDEEAGDDAQVVANLKCALEALRDRKVGTVRWTFKAGSGQFDEYGYHQILADGTAIESRGGVSDLCWWVEDPVTLVTLKSPATFTECLAMPDPAEQFRCLRLATEADLETCIEGETDCGV
ncbi:hypothetical protein [Nannocystis pusilla]|uniref:hypothetical protein n=1 Tax=Nannocystis pusilla TaxID=889268 RepID=UPI003DA69A63